MDAQEAEWVDESNFMNENARSCDVEESPWDSEWHHPHLQRTPCWPVNGQCMRVGACTVVPDSRMKIGLPCQGVDSPTPTSKCVYKDMHVHVRHSTREVRRSRSSSTGTPERSPEMRNKYPLLPCTLRWCKVDTIMLTKMSTLRRRRSQMMCKYVSISPHYAAAPPCNRAPVISHMSWLVDLTGNGYERSQCVDACP